MSATNWISPKFNEILTVKYILVSTGYNNRALSDLECMNIMREKMSYFGECQLGELELCFINENDEYIQNLEKDGSVYILPPERTIRLLYTNHGGFTWIDTNKIVNNELPIYTNQNDTTYIKNVRTSLANIDNHCFVFECSEIAEVSFKDILLNFVNELTEMKFCGFFCPSTLYEVEYYSDKNAIVFKYDTESG